MPWTQTDPGNERMKFEVAMQRGDLTMVEACRQFGISRKTGYKILHRQLALGPEGLRDLPRAPRTHPNQTSPDVEGAVLRVRKTYPTWGSKKILATLLRREPEGEWPARSTVDAILKRAGLVPPRKRRRMRHPSAPPHVDARAPNDVWTMDYKGWFRVGDGTRCDPLTINDAFSRASLVCRAMVAPKTDDVKKQLEGAFHRFGLPSAILSDNGTPFASAGIGGLSRLEDWMLRLGVQSIRIQPGKPEQNGKHERFHETLKAETASPPRATIGAQQNAFTRFQAIYNEERPHEALGMKLPAELYDFSPRQMPAKLPEHEYASDMELRRVRTDGSIKWAGKMLFVGEALEGEVVGLRQVEDDAWSLSLGPMRLATLHERSRVLVPTSPEEVSPMCPDTGAEDVEDGDGWAESEATP